MSAEDRYTDEELDAMSATEDRHQRLADKALTAYGQSLSWPTCERCGERTPDASDTEIGVLCWACLDGQVQADADREYDYRRDNAD